MAEHPIRNGRKILIVGPAWVGDMVMSQVLFILLKQQNPDVIIDVLAPAWSEALLMRMPQVHSSLISPFGHGELRLKERYLLGKKLRAYEYDQVIILPNSLKSALTPFYAKIPQRTGWQGEWPRFLFFNDARKLDKAKLPLMIQRFAALAFSSQAKLPEKLPYPHLIVSQDALNAALGKYGIDNPTAPLLILAPGAEFGPSKRWPARYFAEVAKVKLDQGWDVWLFGSPKDASIAAEIQEHIKHRAVDFVGKTSLAEAVDLMSLGNVVLSNDSGLMHIAAALNLPLIAVYGSTSPKFTPPLGDKVEILNLNLPCSPCFKRECPLKHWRCMLDLTPALVIPKLDSIRAL